MVSYTALFLGSIYTLMIIVIGLDFYQARSLKGLVGGKEGIPLYLFLFKVLFEVAILWLIVAFLGQIWMGWIQI